MYNSGTLHLPRVTLTTLHFKDGPGTFLGCWGASCIVPASIMQLAMRNVGGVLEPHPRPLECLALGLSDLVSALQICWANHTHFLSHNCFSHAITSSFPLPFLITKFCWSWQKFSYQKANLSCISSLKLLVLRVTKHLDLPWTEAFPECRFTVLKPGLSQANWDKWSPDNNTESWNW